MSMPARALKSSKVRCVALPVPLEAKVSCPGLRRASAMSSPTFCTGTDGCAARMCDERPVRVIGAKSRMLSYGTCSYSV